MFITSTKIADRISSVYNGGSLVCAAAIFGTNMFNAWKRLEKLNTNIITYITIKSGICCVIWPILPLCYDMQFITGSKMVLRERYKKDGTLHTYLREPYLNGSEIEFTIGASLIDFAIKEK